MALDGQSRFIEHVISGSFYMGGHMCFHAHEAASSMLFRTDIVHSVHNVGYGGREVAICFTLQLSHAVREDLVQLAKQHLVGVDLSFQRRQASDANAVLSRSCLDSFVELVEDLAGIRYEISECLGQPILKRALPASRQPFHDWID